MATSEDEIADTVETVVQQGPTDLDGALDYDDLLAGASVDHPRPSVPDNHLAVLYHTGGTTGVPKTVPWREGAVELNTKRHALELGLGPDDVGLVATPLFHIGSAIFGSFLVPYTEGRRGLLDRFNPEKTLRWVEHEGVTHTLLVPSMMRAVLGLDRSVVEEYDLNSMEKLAFTGENLDDETKAKINEVFPEAGVFNVYGATEVGSTMALRPGTDRADRCIGVPFADREVTVRDDVGELCDPGERGELWVRGLGKPDGYYRIPEMTAERYRNGPEGDWFATGDVGYEDGDGFFHYAGRLDDRITRGGENIYPSEVETVILAHDEVEEAVVFGVPHDVLGETVAAAVVRRPGSDLASDALREFCRGDLAAYKTPDAVVFREALPRTDAGKFDRKALAAAYGASE